MDVDNAAREGADDAIWDNLAERGQNGNFGIVFRDYFEDFGGIFTEMNWDAGSFGGFLALMPCASCSLPKKRILVFIWKKLFIVGDFFVVINWLEIALIV